MLLPPTGAVRPRLILVCHPCTRIEFLCSSIPPILWISSCEHQARPAPDTDVGMRPKEQARSQARLSRGQGPFPHVILPIPFALTSHHSESASLMQSPRQWPLADALSLVPLSKTCIQPPLCRSPLLAIPILGVLSGKVPNQARPPWKLAGVHPTKEKAPSDWITDLLGSCSTSAPSCRV